MYKLTSNQGPSQDYPILKTSTGEYIFPAADCRQYIEYLEWLSEGNTPERADDAVTWDTIRAKRDQLIAASDWTMIPGATVDQAAWAAYRQVLRDLPQTYAATGPESVVWPTEPSTAGPNTTELE